MTKEETGQDLAESISEMISGLEIIQKNLKGHESTRYRSADFVDVYQRLKIFNSHMEAAFDAIDECTEE